MTSSSSVVPLRQPNTIDDPLTAVLRSGARRLLAQAIKAEADAFLAEMKSLRLPDGRDRVVRHGHGPERQVQTGIGPVAVQRVRLRDRGAVETGERIRFTSAILPRWARAAPDRATAEAAIATFVDKYAVKYEKAVNCLIKDRDALLTFYDFPAEHWDHLRTSNPIESVFATVRHRTVRTKGALSQNTARLMVFTLVMAAAKTWRRLKGEN